MLRYFTSFAGINTGPANHYRLFALYIMVFGTQAPRRENKMQ